MPVLDELEGCNLSAVTFVQDYLQIQFDGPLLSLFVWPRVVASATIVSFGMTGYRDALCAQIGKTVGRVAEEVDVALRLHFTDGAMIEVSLLPNARQGPEAAIFQDGKGALVVW